MPRGGNFEQEYDPAAFGGAELWTLKGTVSLDIAVIAKYVAEEIVYIPRITFHEPT